MSRHVLQPILINRDQLTSMVSNSMENFRQTCLTWLLFLLLANFQLATDAYVSVNLDQYCKPEGSPATLRLQPRGVRSAITVELNVKTHQTPVTDQRTGDARCRLEVVAPPSHVLTVHLARPKDFLSSKPSQKRLGFLPCFLKLSHTSKESNADILISRMQSRTLDLCDGSEPPRVTLFLGSQLMLSWSPPDASLADKMIATHLVITAVGKGAEICNSRHRMYCLEKDYHTPLCIPIDLVCDGFDNCPKVGNDENPEECAVAAIKSSLDSSEEVQQQAPHQIIGAFLTRAVMKQINKESTTLTTTEPWQKSEREGGRLMITTGMLKDMSDLILKKLLNKHKSGLTGADSNATSNTTPTPLYQLHSTDSSKMGPVPSSLFHHGPWGYLLVGFLICGAILLLCGLWECCCRPSKLPPGGPVSTSAATTVFIINSAPNVRTHRSHHIPEEPPPTPGPPSYEELDQPPAYSSLFPMTKSSDTDNSTNEDNRVIGTEHI